MGAHSAVWQGYVDSSLMGSGQFDKAAILSYDFSDVEATSAGFTITPQELESIKNAFSSSEYGMQHGFTLGGDKFFAIKADERSLYGKKLKEGAVVVRTPSCVLVGHHPETVQTPNAATAIEGVADYLIGASRG